MPEAPPPAPSRNELPTTESRVFAIDRTEAARADEWIEALGQQWGESPRTIFGARICISELFANVIEHGVRKSDRDCIAVTLVRRPDGIAIEFMDTCAPFDPTAATDPEKYHSIESATIGGRGMMLIRTYARELTYRGDSSGNRITLRIEA